MSEESSLDKDKFELAKFMAAQAEGEANRRWTGHTVFLAVNTGLIAVLGLIRPEWGAVVGISVLGLLLVPACLGLLISLSWFWLSNYSDYYVHRWVRDLEEVIKDDQVLRHRIRARNRTAPWPDSRRRPWGSSQLFFNMVPLAFVLFWGAAIAIVLRALVG
jgi:hypothetical protein